MNSDEKIVVSLSNDKISLEEMFANYEGDNLAKDFEWDKNSIGKEVW